MGTADSMLWPAVLSFISLTIVLSAEKYGGDHKYDGHHYGHQVYDGHQEYERHQKSLCDSICQDVEDGLASQGCCPDFSCLCTGGSGFAITCKCPDCGFCVSRQTCIPMGQCRDGEGCCPDTGYQVFRRQESGVWYSKPDN